MTKHSSSTATVSAGGDALLAGVTGPVAIAAGDSSSVVTISVGSAEASLTVAGAATGTASLTAGSGSGEICGAGGVSAGRISAGSAEASLMAGGSGTVSVIVGAGAAATAAAMSAVKAMPSSIVAARGTSARSSRLRSLARDTAAALAPLFSMRAGA